MKFRSHSAFVDECLMHGVNHKSLDAKKQLILVIEKELDARASKQATPDELKHNKRLHKGALA